MKTGVALPSDTAWLHLSAPGTVERPSWRVEQKDSWEVTVRFRRGHQFLLDSIDG